MPLGRKIFAAILTVALAYIAEPLHALKVDDFNAYPTGMVAANGGNVTGGIWSTLGTNNAAIADSAGNKVLSFGAAANAHAFRGLPAGMAIDDTETATLFFRFRANAANPNNSMGL